VATMKSRAIFVTGLWRENPVFRQILGICSALAVTNLLVNTLIMSLGLIFVTSMSNVTVSILRGVTPPRIRMMVQTLVIASYVIIVDITLKAYLPDISQALGPYVGLIITNCIIMGRCEAFARNNPVLPSLLDGIASGCGYAFVLLSVAFQGNAGLRNALRDEGHACSLDQLDDHGHGPGGILHAGDLHLGRSLFRPQGGEAGDGKVGDFDGTRAQRFHHILCRHLHQ